MRDFYQEIIDIIGSGGEPCCVIPLGDPAFENAAHTTVTTKGQGALDGLVFTYSEARTGFDAATIYIRNQFRTPLLPFNDNDEEADTPDTDAWSRDDASGEGFSFGCAADIVDDGTNHAFLAKWTTSGGLREWEFYTFVADRPTIQFLDESAGVTPSATISDSAKLAVGRNILVSTYDGSGGALAMDGTEWYVNGLLSSLGRCNNGSYVAMEAKTSVVDLAQIDVGIFWNSWMATMFFTHRVLNAVEVFNLNDIYVDMQRADRSRLLAGVL